MLISVIVTCYNLELYISKALESVLNQDCDPCLFEIVIVDDCSTDRSAEIVKKYKSVRYVKTPKNGGVLLATIYGIQHAKGDVIAFLDGDDVWRFDKLSRIAARFREDNSLVFLTHNYEFIDENGRPTAGLEYTQEIFNQCDDPDQINKLIVDGILHRRNYVWLGSAYSIRLKPEDIAAFIDWATTLPNPQLTYQDWPLAFWIAASSSGRFGYDSAKLFSYRVHSTNFSGDSKSLEKAIRNWSKAYFTSLGLVNLADKFSCTSSIKNVCESALRRDGLILQLFKDPSKFSFFDMVRNWRCFGSFKQGLTELIRVLIVKCFGFRFYFSAKNLKR